MAVAFALPFALTVFEIDASEVAAIEAEGKVLVNDEIVEVGLQSGGGPTLCGGPSTGSLCDRNSAYSNFGAEAGTATDQYVAVGGDGRLHNAVALPRVLPKQRAVTWGNTR